MHRGFLPNKPALRGAVGALLGTAALYVVVQIVFPGTEPGEGTPLAILFLGASLGIVTALVAAGIILIYRTSRIINFAQAALGSGAGVLAYNILVLMKWPWALAVVLGLLASLAVAVMFELVFVRRFFKSPRLILTVATIAAVPMLSYLTQSIVPGLFGSALADRTREETLGVQSFQLPFNSLQFQVGSIPYPFHSGHVITLGLALLAFIGLGMLLKFTRYGVAIRASAENMERAELLGVNVGGVSTLVWGVAGLLSGLGVISLMTMNRSAPPVETSATIVAIFLPALTAAVIARMQNLPIGIAAAIALSILKEATRWSFENHLALFDGFLLLVILVGLLLQRDRMNRSEERDATSWEASEDIRPVPKELLALPGIRAWRWALIVIGLLAVLVFPLAATPGQTNTLAFMAIVGIVLLSLVVLTGWAGQLSLGQFGILAVTAAVAGALTHRAGISFWLAIPLVAIIGAALATVLGLPALRIRGLYLGVATLAFAAAIEGLLFQKRYFGWLLPDRVDRPVLFFFDFEDERSMYYLCIVAFVLATIVVSSLRRSRPGRILIAARDNEPNVQSFGVNVVRARMLAFAISGTLCGVAGVLMAHHQRAVTQLSFKADESLIIFMTAIVGGVGSVSGAIAGAAFFGLTRVFAGNPIVGFLREGGALLAILYIAPGGLASIFYAMRDSILKIVAQRRQIVVPSLFADYDPEAVEKRLAPLAEPIPHSGLAALPVGRRYRGHSDIYAGRRWIRPKKRTENLSEAAAITAAAGAEAAKGGL